MADVTKRLREAADALLTVQEFISEPPRSLRERDGAILRLVYTFEAVWKATQALLAETEGVATASPAGAVRAARRVGWLTDDEAEAALQLAIDRNLTVHMYKRHLGDEVYARFPQHVSLLSKWLRAMEAHQSRFPGGL